MGNRAKLLLLGLLAVLIYSGSKIVRNEISEETVVERSGPSFQSIIEMTMVDHVYLSKHLNLIEDVSKAVDDPMLPYLLTAKGDVKETQVESSNRHFEAEFTAKGALLLHGVTPEMLGVKKGVSVVVALEQSEDLKPTLVVQQKTYDIKRANGTSAP